MRKTTYLLPAVAIAIAAALVWVALEEPATAAQIVERLGHADLARPTAEIADVARQLVEAGWARTSAGGDT